MKFIQEGSAEGIPEKSVIKVGDIFPNGNVAGATFRDETVNVWIPLKVTSESVKNTDESGSKGIRHVYFMKHAKNNTSDSREKTVEK